MRSRTYDERDFDGQRGQGCTIARELDKIVRVATASAGPGQGIALRTGRFFLDWTLRFTHPTVVIDGRPHELPWGEHYFPLEPGSHQVEVSYRYLGLSRAGRAMVVIDLAPNQVVRATYRAPTSVLIASSPGKLTVELPAAQA